MSSRCQRVGDLRRASLAPGSGSSGTPGIFPSLLSKEGMREATASRDADLAVGVVALSSASHAVLSPVPVLPTSDQASRRGSLCADHSPVVVPARRLPRASGL